MTKKVFWDDPYAASYSTCVSSGDYTIAINAPCLDGVDLPSIKAGDIGERSL